MTSGNSSLQERLFGCLRFYRVLAPILSTQLLTHFPTLLAFWMLSKLGSKQMAASALGLGIYYTVQIAFSSIFSGFSMLVSHARGKNKKDMQSVAEIVHSGLIVLLVCSLLSAGVILLIPSILPLLGQPKDLLPILRQFFYWSSIRIIVRLSCAFMCQYLNAIHFSWVSTFVTIIRPPIFIFFAYTFILGHFGFSAMGVVGLTMTAMVTGLIELIILFLAAAFNSGLNLRGGLFSAFSCRLHLVKKIFKLGVSLSVTSLGVRSSLSVLILLIGLYGKTMLAAYEVVNQFILLFWTIIYSCSEALRLLTSYYCARKDRLYCEKSLAASLRLAFLFWLLFSFFLAFDPALVASLYAHTSLPTPPLWLKPAEYFMYIAVVYLMIYAFIELLSGSLQGLGKSASAAKLTLLPIWLFVLPFSFIVSRFIIPGAISLRACYVVALLFPAYMIYRLWKKNIGALGLAPAQKN